MEQRQMSANSGDFETWNLCSQRGVKELIEDGLQSVFQLMLARATLKETCNTRWHRVNDGQIHPEFMPS
jgi:hypothetical protein